LEIKNQKSKIKNLNNKECQFGYRDSLFKKNPNLIILSAILQLKKGNQKKIRNEIKKNLEQRKETQPLNFPSAGSIFKNQKPSLAKVRRSGRRKGSSLRPSKIKNQRLLKEFPELKEFNKKGMIPAGWLIDKCGLKGKRIGNAKISEKHANFIVNLGEGQAKDVKKLINLVKKRVKNKFGVELEEEIQYLGFKTKN